MESTSPPPLNIFVSVIEIIDLLHTDMRRDIQEIFRNTPRQKQVMMISTLLSKEIRFICMKFMQFDAVEIL